MTKTFEKSRFHWLLSSERGLARDLWDQELLGSESFAVVPSLGALVPGWLLIVPRRAMVSLRELNVVERNEIDLLVNRVAEALGNFRGEIFAFEHGSAQRGSTMGCGVDHAHLHVVPLDFDLVDWAILQVSPDMDWKVYPELLLTDLPSTGEYISVWHVNSRRGAVATVSKPVSQWMRRAIASKLGVHEDWDYRASPQVENIQATVEAIHRRTMSLTK